jgi:amino acid transporter
LRRDLGTLESYAALIGILIGAGIFQVTSQAWALTGPSVILGYLLLTPCDPRDLDSLRRVSFDTARS